MGSENARHDSTDRTRSAPAPESHQPELAALGRWVAVNTQPHREHIAHENLARQGFETYCPVVRRRIRHARRVDDVLRPFFPGYLFVRVAMGVQRWRPMLSTVGVRAIVRCGDRLSFVQNAFIECLKAREIDGAIVKPTSPYEVGQAVRMQGGAFDGLVATIVALDERSRLVVLMDLLNQSVKVNVDASRVAPLSYASACGGRPSNSLAARF